MIDSGVSQSIRLQCLEIASRLEHAVPDNVIPLAQKMYDFIVNEPIKPEPVVKRAA
jgi:hypothetical protein